MDPVDILRCFLILMTSGALIYLAVEYIKKQNTKDEGFEQSLNLSEEENKKKNKEPLDFEPPFLRNLSTANDAKPSEPEKNKNMKTVEKTTSQNKLPKECFPKDKLTAEDLLPRDSANSTWAKVNPAGQGDVKDQNFLNAGFHVGINTVGNSLRNPNMQLRSEPPNPQVKVSPWNQTTIESDLNRRPLEIGGCE